MTDTARRLEELGAYYDASLPPALYADPHINSLTPATASAAAGAVTVTVAGYNFEAGSVVEIATAAQPTTYVSPTALTVSYDPAAAGTFFFTVRNPNDEESNSVAFTVAAEAAADETSTEPEPTEEPCEPEAEPEAPAPTAKRSNGKGR
jgi:hypothetical protein